MEGKTKRKITCNISLVITIIGLLILITGTSYAALIGSASSSSEQIIRAGGVTLTLTENYESINKKIIVLEDADGLLQEDVYEFNIKNTGSIAARYDVKIINELSGENVLPLEYIKVGLEINGEEYGPFNLGEEEGIIDSGVIYNKEIINYSLRIWLDKEYEESIEEIEGKMANLKIVVEAEQRPNSMDKGESKEFSYTGDVEEYIVPRDGWYYIELGGASGNAPADNEGYSKGAVTSGYIELEAGEKLYFYIGEQGKKQKTSTFNGGGGGGYGSAGYTIPSTISGDTGNYGYSGGGATDVRLVGGTWDNTTSLISRIMVAGGGGSASSSSTYNTSGDNSMAGGLYGRNGGYYTGHGDLNTYGEGATQISGGSGGVNLNSYGTNNAGSFGKGGTSNSYSSGVGSSGGGGGYYGGGSGAGTGGGGTGHGAGGGSSYISGYAGVNSVEESTTITHTNQTLHYSGKYFIGGSMISGANSGDGYAKIVYVDTKPKKKNTNLNNVRYIKDCSSYNTYNDGNYWIEIQAIVDGVNVAKGKTVTGTTPATSGYPYSRITDGDITYTNYATPSSATPVTKCVVVDLGSTYDLDEVAIWNYFGNPRSFYDNIASVSSNNSTWKEVINEATIQTSNGRRINAYTDTYNGYVQDDLILWYDGYANTSTYHDNTSETWKDLSGTGNDGTLSGGTWNRNYLSFDGVDDTVDTNLYLADALSSDRDITLSITLKINSVPFTNTTYGNTGVLFGGAYYGGTGIVWVYTPEQYLHFYGYDRLLNAGGSFRYGNYASYLSQIMEITYVRNVKSNAVIGYVNGYKVVSGGYSSGSYEYPDRIGNIGINKKQIMFSNYDTSYANMDVYSAKIYNKALTEEEVLHNYLYDKQTFNIE